MSQKPAKSPKFLWLFFVIAFGWTWAFWVPLALEENGQIQISDGMVAALMDGKPAAWGPLIAAMIVAFCADGREGIRRIFNSMIRIRFSMKWYLVALFLVPAIVGMAQAIASASGAAIDPSEALLNPVSIPIAFVWIFFFGGPLQEEAGWRGTVSPLLQSPLGAFGASLITGVFWAIWHLPLFYLPRGEIYYNQPFWGLLASTIMLSVLFTWTYRNTGQSLFAAMLMHTSWNWANYVFTGLRTDSGGLAFLVLMAGTVLIVASIFGPRTLVREIEG